MRKTKALVPKRAHVPASESKWRYSYIERVSYYVLAGYVESAQLAPLFGVSPATVSAWKERYPAFKEAIHRAEAIVTASAVSLIVEDIEAGNVDTAKWWLTKRSEVFKDKKDEGKTTGDITVQIVNYGNTTSE